MILTALSKNLTTKRQKTEISLYICELLELYTKILNMNKKTLLIISTFILSTIIPVFSQTRSSDSLEQGTEPAKETHNAYKTTWQKNRFKDTWFITFAGGVQTIMAEDDDKAAFGDRLTFAPSLTIGKYFSPIWGLKLQITGASLHGYNDGDSGEYKKWNSGSKAYMGEGYVGRPYYPDSKEYISTWDPQWNYMGWHEGNQIAKDANGYYWIPGRQGELYRQHIRYIATNLTFMFDFLTLVGDYNPKRGYDISPFAGISYAHVLPHKGTIANDVLGVNAGLSNKIRLSNKFDINIDGNLTFYPDDFDGHSGGGRNVDIVAQATVGLTYKIGKSTWEICEPMDYQKIQDLTDKINSLRNDLANVKCPDCPECPVVDQPIEVRTRDYTFLPDPVFFRLDKSIIDANEWSKIEKAVNYLSEYTDANVIVTGYADKKTGYPAYNMRLSERRAKAVADALINKYGVNPMRITINWEGDKIQPFEINNWNRVVVFVIDN